MKIRGLRGWLLLVAVLTVLGSVLGAVGLAMRPPSYTSTASTSISADSEAADPSVLQGVTATLFMMMPVYAGQASSQEVLEAAASASGLTSNEVAQGLQVERTIDSSVLSWSMTAPRPEQATAALRAATSRFSDRLPQTGPKSAEGEPLLTVGVPAEASDAARGPLTPLVGAGAGAALGLLAGLAAMLLLYRGRSASVADWDDIERRLGLPIVADLSGPDSHRSRQWGYVADRLSTSVGGGQVGLYGVSTPAAESDATALRVAMRRSDHLSPQVSNGGAILESTSVSAQDLAGAVILLNADRQELDEVASDCRAMARSVSGPVVGVLDHRSAHR